MILPVVRERLEPLLRQPGLESALVELRTSGRHTAVSGLQDVAKALACAYVASELRRPAFLIVDSNKRAEAIAETVRFFGNVFPSTLGGIALLPAFDSLPWEARSPHADILERRAATLYRLAAGQLSLVIAPVQAALWRYRDFTDYFDLARQLERDTEIGLEALIAHLGAVGYARTEMVELPGQFAVRGGIIDAFSPEAPRPVRIELLGDTVESVREFDARTQRSIAPVVRTLLLPLTEWSVPGEGTEPWNLPAYWGPKENAGQNSLFELNASSLKPLVFFDEPQAIRE